MPKFLRRVGHGAPPSRLSLMKSALLGDDAAVQRGNAARERAARAKADADAEQVRRDSVARWIDGIVKREGAWFPSDWR